MRMTKKVTTMPKWLTIKQLTDKQADMFIGGEIVTDEWNDSDTSASGFRDALQSVGDVKTINLHINSPGGSVFEGIAIYNMLKQHQATVNVYVDGLAASIASVVAMAGNRIYMPQNAMLMIHNPWTMAVGNATELRKQADDLDQIAKSSITTYLSKAGDKLDEETLKQMMDEETWLTAEEALEYGLADNVMEPNKMAASISDKYKARYHNVPDQLIMNSSEKVDKRKNGLTDDQRQTLIEETLNRRELVTTQLKQLQGEQ